MAITVEHQLSPYVSGQAAYESQLAIAQQREQARQDQLAMARHELSQRDRQMAEQERRGMLADELDQGRLSLAQQELAQQGGFQDRQLTNAERQAQLANDLQQGQMAQENYQFQQKMIDAKRARDIDLAAKSMQLGMGAWETAYQGGLQQQLQSERIGASLFSDQLQAGVSRSNAMTQAMTQLEKERQAEIAKRLMGNFDAIQTARQRGGLDDAQYQQALDELNGQYNSLGEPIPFATDPQEDPELAATQAEISEQWPGAVVQRDAKGKQYLLVKPEQTEAWQRTQQDFELEKVREANKDNFAKQQMDRAKAEREFHQEGIAREQKLKADAANQKIAIEQKTADYKLKVSNSVLDAYIKKNEAISKSLGTGKEPDTSAIDAVIAELEAKLKSDPAGGANQPPAWYLALPSGAKYTAPDGTERIKP